MLIFSVNTTNLIFPKWVCTYALLACVGLNFSHAQIQPLSRHDKAIVESLEAEYQQAMDAQDRKEASRHLNAIAFVHWEHNDYRQAIEYYERSLTLNEQLGNENGIAMLHDNLGTLYSDVEEYDTALDHFQKTLAARKSFKNKEGLIAALKNISVVQNNLGMYSQSVDALQEALSNAVSLGDVDLTSSCYLYLSETYEKMGDVDNTRKYYELYQEFQSMKQRKEIQEIQAQADKDSILKEIAELNAQMREEELLELQNQLTTSREELDQFDAELLLLTDSLEDTEMQMRFLETEKENQRLESEREIREQKALGNLLLLGVVSMIVISFFIYRNYRHEQRSKQALAQKNRQINEQNTELENLNKIIARHNERMQTELNVGREIQMSMIPSDFPDIRGVDLFAVLVPAREVGGDLYDFFQPDDNHLIFGVGDVSDKGVPAALFMAVTRTLVKTTASYSSLPRKILTQVNRELSADNESSMFVTYFLCVLNTQTGRLNYCNAGHNPPLFISSSGHLRKLDKLHGPALGAAEDYEYKQDTVIMKKGEQLILYTDGVTEAMNEQEAAYSQERLDQIFSSNGSQNSKESVEAIIEDVGEFRNGAEQSDDITVMSLIYTGEPK